jgi:hypothetical protein
MASIPWVGQKLAPAPFALSIETVIQQYLADCRCRGLSPKTVDFAYAYPPASLPAVVSWGRRRRSSTPLQLAPGSVRR